MKVKGSLSDLEPLSLHGLNDVKTLTSHGYSCLWLLVLLFICNILCTLQKIIAFKYQIVDHK